MSCAGTGIRLAIVQSVLRMVTVDLTLLTATYVLLLMVRMRVLKTHMQETVVNEAPVYTHRWVSVLAAHNNLEGGERSRTSDVESCDMSCSVQNQSYITNRIYQCWPYIYKHLFCETPCPCPRATSESHDTCPILYTICEASLVCRRHASRANINGKKQTPDA